MRALERPVELVLFRSRWLLLPIHLGLAVLLVFMTVVSALVMAFIEKYLSVHYEDTLKESG